MRSSLFCSLIVLLLSSTAACAPAAAPRASGEPGGPSSAANANRALVMAVRYEVVGLAAKRLEAAASQMTKRPFNASLAMIDSSGAARPYLADKLPQLNSEDWKVFPDGGMETTYRLKPNLTWHDGEPLTADDFAFAYQVYSTRGLGAFTSSPQDQVQEMHASDAGTLVIRWRGLSGDAGALVDSQLDALPHHILEGSFSAYQSDPSTVDALLGAPFWTTQYVGLGPYKVVRWEPGTQIEGEAFDGHALGRPKINRIVIRFIPDENTVMSNLIAGAIDIAGDNAIRFEHATEIKRQLGDQAVALMRLGARHYIGFQFRPDILRTPALLDVRVRKALAHATDRDPINEALFEKQGVMIHHWAAPGTPYYAQVERVATRYPFDPRRVEQLMGEAGLTKDSGGMFVSPTGEPFRPQLMVDGSPLFEREMDVIRDTWTRIAIDSEPKLLPAVESRILSARATYPDMYGLSTGGREGQLDIFSSAQIAAAERGWAGNNRMGWSHPDYERGWAAFNSLLDRGQRDQQIIEMMKVATDQLPGIPVFFNIAPVTHTAALRGPDLGTPESLYNWNQYLWEWA